MGVFCGRPQKLGSARAWFAVLALLPMFMTVDVGPVFGATSGRDSAAALVEASLQSAIAAVDRKSYQNAAAKETALEKAVASVGRDGLAPLEFALLVAAALLIDSSIGHGNGHSCGSPSCS
jgi:hypothetical protein